MKTLAISSFFVLFAIVSIASMPSAFADHAIAEVEPVLGSGTPGCEETPEGCWTVMEAVIDVGGEVTWINTDSQPHTATSGSDLTSPDVGLLFDSGLLMNGDSFSHTFDAAGEYAYFCMVHPWMIGVVIVQAEGAGDGGGKELMVTITDSATDGGVQVDLKFNQMHVNYDITATQDGDVVWQETEQHAHENMMGSHMIPITASEDNPIDIEIVSLGIGLPGEEMTGPIGEIVASKHIIPEFGTIAMMVLGVSIVSIIALTAKSKVIPRL
jgi:predicted secreted protein with PEFG-CTERM motif